MSKASSQARPAQRRSTLLTIALVLVILQGIFLAVVYWTVLPDAQRTLGNIALWLMLLAAVADVVAGIAMWFWKRWGILPVWCGRNRRRGRGLAGFRRPVPGIWGAAAVHYCTVHRSDPAQCL